MEADISIWRKPGHFYFALTCRKLSKVVVSKVACRTLRKLRGEPQLSAA